ncbi:hypothetical protein APICC_01497 [Apis cerana cerana]|uniref:Uncharacterized protein n=1 Tax=Apis cerana cerana TaxID=94128 RepID=A0A2A3E2Q3_APICC|nr:hypothetical protein APICC_01497 [Apis cerana cerana]
MFVKEKESLFSSSEETDIPEDQNKISPKGTIWKKIKDDVSSGRPIHNIFKDVAGLTGYAKKNIIKSTKQKIYEKLEKWRENHNKEVMEMVEKCREIEQASRIAFNIMIDEKKQKAAEVTKESRQLKTQLIKQRENEIQRKIKLIQEIRTIQSLRELPFKDFDPTETNGFGLLCEIYDKSLSKPQQQFQHITSSKIDALRKKVEERKALRLEKKGDRKLI